MDGYIKDVAASNAAHVSRGIATFDVVEMPRSELGSERAYNRRRQAWSIFGVITSYPIDRKNMTETY